MKLLSGSSNPTLGSSIARSLKVAEIKLELSTFANGEKRVWIKDSVQGENVILVQSFSNPTDEHLMETLLIADALERQGARHVNLVIPWMGYSLQDKVFRPGEPIAAKVVANLISHSHIKRVFLFDLHNSSTPGFFSIPSHHLTASELFAQYAKKSIGLENAVIASPDFGGLKRAHVFAEKLNIEIVKLDKHRDIHTGNIIEMGLSGTVSGKKVILLDDVILSGGTAIEAAKLLKDKGASEVHFLATHGIFVDGSLEKIKNSHLDTVVITNSIAHPKLPENIKQLDSASIFIEALRGWL
jgi:ribose-phosphate pyrophosphokinase